MHEAQKSLRGLNLNLLPVLRALLREASVSAAARSVGLSQSATSTCLAQLRAILADPLLVKVGRTMRLTPRARSLIAPLEQACAALEDLIQPPSFDPGRAGRRFVVATPDYVGYLLGAELIRVLAETAPGVSVRFVDVPPDLRDRMASGSVDVAIVAADLLRWTGFSSAPAMMDDLVVVAGRDHPLAGCDSLTPDELARYSQVCWHPGLDGQIDPRPTPALAGWKPRFLTQQFTVLPLLALESDSLALAPRSLARRLATRLPLKLFEPPFESVPFLVSVIWSPVHDADPAHRWFRGLAADALRRIGD